MLKKLFAALFGLLALTGQCLGAITLNSAAGGTANFVAASTFTQSVTVGAGTNTVLVVAIGLQAGTSILTGAACTYNSVAFATILAGNASGNPSNFLFAIRNPTVGTANLVCSWGGANSITAITWQAFDGVDTSSDANAFKNANAVSGTGTVVTGPITNVTNGLVVFATSQVCCSSVTNTGTQTVPTGLNNQTGAVGIAFGYIGPTSAGSQADQWTISAGGGAWSDVGVSLAPAGTGGGGIAHNNLLTGM